MKYKAPKQFAFIDGSGRFRRMTSAIWDDKTMQACVNNIPHKAAYESVFQFPDWTGGRLTADIARSAIIDRVFIDLDDKADPLRAIRDAGKIATYFAGFTTNNFSGMKGAHVMIHCDPTDLIPDLKGSVLTRFAIELVGLRSNELANLSMEKITSMAKQPRGLIQRPKTSKWVTEQLQLIEEEIIRERMQKLVDDHMIGHRNAYELGCLLQTDRKQEVWDFMMETEEIVRRIQMKKLENLPKTSGGRTPEETWLLKVIEIFKIVHRAANIQPAGSLIGTSASEHEARCHLVNLANDCGWTHGEIADIFSGADDYNQKVTEGQIRSIIGR
jgi:hypothetical protein